MKNQLKKNVRVAFALLLVLMFSGMSFAIGGTLAGSGTQASPYLIADAADLKAFAKGVNDGNYVSTYAELAADIDMNPDEKVLNDDGTLFGVGARLEKWTPIKNFKGHFDGKGYTIRGLFFSDASVESVGLFASVIGGGVVQNVGVIDSYFKGRKNVGGVVGYVYGGTVSGSYNKGYVDGTGFYVGGVVGYLSSGTVSSSYNTGSVNGSDYSVGGVVGYVYGGSVSNSYNTGTVSGYDLYVGGVVGYVYGGSVSKSYNTGSVNSSSYRVGGVVGGLSGKGSVEKSYNTGSVNGSYSQVGGVVGYLDSASTVGGSYNTGAVHGGSIVGGVVGHLYDGTVSNSYNTGSVNGSYNQVGGVVGQAGYYINYSSGSIVKSGIVNQCFSTGEVNGSADVGCLGGLFNSGRISDSYYNESCSKSAININSESSGYVVKSNVGSLTAEQLASQGMAYQIKFFDTDGSTLLKETFVAYKEKPVPPAVEYVEEDDDFYYDEPSWTPVIVPAEKIAAYTLVRGSTPKGVDISVTVADGSPVAVSSASRCVIAQVTGVKDDATGTQLSANALLTGGKNYTVTMKVSLSTAASCSEDYFIKNFKAKEKDLPVRVNGLQSDVVLSKSNNYSASVSTSVLPNCTITFVGLDGTELEKASVAPGKTPEPPSVTVEREDNEYYHYFVKWTPEIAAATGNTTYQAVLDSSLKRLDVTAEMCDGNSVVLKTPSPCIDATALHLEYNDKIMTVNEVRNFKLTGGMSYKLHLGVSAKKDEACQEDDYVKAIKNSDSDVKIFVNGVDSENSLPAANNYLTGFYFSGVVSYLITFLDSDGETVLKKSGVAPDAMPVPPELPIVEDDETYHYKTGWDKEIVAATGNATYTLVKTSIPWAEAELLGSGTEADPYLIGTAQALRNFAAKVNGGEKTAVAVLMADIDLNPGKTVLNEDGTLYNKGAGLKTWTPIGTSSAKYMGTFDGNGHTISGLYFSGGGNSEYVGLFGYISGSTAKVQNVGVVDSYFEGNAYVGGVVGFIDSSATVSNVYNTGTVSGYDLCAGGVVGYNYLGTVSNVYNTGTVSAGWYAGGVIGDNENGTVSDVYNTGSVSGSEYVGGVVGGNSTKGTVSNVYNTGTVSGETSSVGGVVGVNENGTVSDVYNTGAVSGGKYVGGVVGANHSTVSNVYNTGTVSGDSCVGGVVGYNPRNGTVSNVYNTGAVSGDNSVGGVVGYNPRKGTVSNGFFNTAYYSGNAIGVDGGTANNVVGMTSAELAELNVATAFTFAEGEKNPWVAGSVVSNNGSVTYKFPYLAVFGEKSQPVFTPAIEFAANNASATVYGATTGSVNIPADVEVTGNILFDRSFAKADSSAFSTMMLPFTPKSIPEGVSFFAFDSVSQKDGKWSVVMKVADSVVANTPYLVQVSSGAEAISFADGGTFKATDGEHATVSGNWKFVGTYEYKAWPENDPGIGKTYGFAGSTGNDPDIVGKFAKVGAGAYIYPMRAYLEYSAPAQVGRPAANGETRTVASLPNEIDVLISEKDETTGEQTTRVIGTLNTRTGEFKAAADRYFDMKGRFLGVKKPTAKGTYYNNGKKVIVK